jgi:23S rRNA (guanosine2251-2'-O)-methyltransferase
MADQIEGKNAVIEALVAGKEISRIVISNRLGKKSGIYEMVELAKHRGVPIQRMDYAELEHISKTNNSQGIIAFLADSIYCDLEQVYEFAAKKNEPLFLIILDGVEDPHNLGAIIRSAEGAGAHGVVIPKRRAASVNATVAKTSAGAISHVNIVRIANINNFIRELKKDKVWIVGLDEDAAQYMYKANLREPLALIVGGEGQGLSRLVKESCDFLVKFPMRGKVNSLNASVAAALAMYEVVRQRGK